MTTMRNTIIGRMFHAAEAAVLIVNAEGDHADLARIVDLYRQERELNPESYLELRERWGDV